RAADQRAGGVRAPVAGSHRDHSAGGSVSGLLPLFGGSGGHPRRCRRQWSRYGGGAPRRCAATRTARPGRWAMIPVLAAVLTAGTVAGSMWLLVDPPVHLEGRVRPYLARHRAFELWRVKAG